MNKKIALVKLIRNSLIVPNEDKLVLLGNIGSMKNEDVEELGKFLAEEHDFILQNETGLRANVGEIMEMVKKWNPQASSPDVVKDSDKVYVGVGKP